MNIDALVDQYQQLLEEQPKEELVFQPYNDLLKMENPPDDLRMSLFEDKVVE